MNTAAGTHPHFIDTRHLHITHTHHLHITHTYTHTIYT
ncbi:hypothetical protein LEMLEM_LOCUS11247 [Lemmus lemmus]